MTAPRPLPRLAQAILRWALPEEDREPILADLAELWRREQARVSRARATWWIGRETASFATRFLIERAREVARLRGRLVTRLEWKLAVRAIRRTPLLTAAATLSLAVGITLAAAVFGVVDAILFARLDVPAGERIVQLRDRDAARGWDLPIEHATFLRRREGLRSFTDLGVFGTEDLLIEPPGGPGRVISTASVSLNTFTVLAVGPAAGRGFSTSDEADLAVCLIAAELARDLFGSEAAALGKPLRVDGRTRVVLGVMPAGFRFPFQSRIWLPISLRPGPGPGLPALRAFGRLAPGVSIAAARAELAAVAPGLEERRPDDPPIQIQVFRFAEPTGASWVRWVLWAAVGALIMLLVVSAANVANLLAARAAARTFEFAVRSALGAGRSRLYGQLLLEAAAIAVVAAAVGAAGAAGAMRWIRGAVVDLPFWIRIDLDARVVLFIALLAALATAIVAVLPARRLDAVSAADVLKDGATGVRFGRVGAALVALELMVAVGFLGGTASVGRGLAAFGFRGAAIPAEKTLTAQLYFGQPPELAGAAGPTDPARRGALWAGHAARSAAALDRLLLDLAARPGVVAAAAGSHFPGSELAEAVFELADPAGPVRVRSRVIETGPGYFEAVGVAIRAGRDFLPEERGAAADEPRAALVNEAFLRRHRLRAGLGHRIRRVTTDPDGESRPGPWLEIVGIVPDLALNPGNPARQDGIYLPLEPSTVVRIALRTGGAAEILVPLVHEAAQRLDPKPDVQWTKTVAAQMAEPVALFRALGLGLAGLGAIALLLSAAGLHALLSLAIVQQRRDLAIRLALGAGRWPVIRAALARTGIQVAIGSGGGILLGVGISALLASLPFELERRAGAAAVGMAVVLAIVGASGCLVPLRRALRVRPVELLRG